LRIKDIARLPAGKNLFAQSIWVLVSRHAIGFLVDIGFSNKKPRHFGRGS
jgi:hypothetical protein